MLVFTKISFPERRTVPLWQEPDTDNTAVFFHTHGSGIKSTITRARQQAVLHNITGRRHREVSEPE